MSKKDFESSPLLALIGQKEVSTFLRSQDFLMMYVQYEAKASKVAREAYRLGDALVEYVKTA